MAQEALGFLEKRTTIPPARKQVFPFHQPSSLPVMHTLTHSVMFDFVICLKACFSVSCRGFRMPFPFSPHPQAHPEDLPLVNQYIGSLLGVIGSAFLFGLSKGRFLRVDSGLENVTMNKIEWRSSASQTGLDNQWKSLEAGMITFDNKLMIPQR